MTTSDMLDYHRQKLSEFEVGLKEWQDVPLDGTYMDAKCKTSHIETFQSIVDFHKSAVRWLERQ